MDADVAQAYADAQVEGVKPSFVLPILRLHMRGPLTITELAASVQQTHSAMSQKVAAMRTAGWVRTSPGADARSKRVHLTAKGRLAACSLAAVWRATETAVAAIDAEIPYAFSRVVCDIEEALRRRSFAKRIADRRAGASE